MQTEYVFIVTAPLVVLVAITIIFKYFSKLHFYSAATFLGTVGLDKLRIFYGRLALNPNSLLNKSENQYIRDITASPVVYVIFNILVLGSTIWLLIDINNRLHSLSRIVLNDKVILPNDDRVKEMEKDDKCPNVTELDSTEY